MHSTLLYLIISIIVIEFAISKVLSLLNLKTWEKPIPAELADVYREEAFIKAKNYALDNNRVESISSTITIVLSIAFLYFGGYAYVDMLARSISSSAILDGLIFFGLLTLGSSIISLPFEVYSTFVIEERYGFNKTTPSTFILDKIKGAALGAIIGAGIYSLLAYLYQLLGGYFWMAGWGVVAAFSLFMAAFYTSILLPIFNKLTPLGSGELRTKIEAYASQVAFPLTNIMVMDGSKRSAKANAFFSGIGSKKSIVLYDTLINDLSHEEITAVLAHEVGHYQKKHVTQSMILGVAQMGLLFFLFGYIASSHSLAAALGAKENSFYLSLVAFSMLYSPVSTILSLGMNVFSRKNEYEADAYARDTYSAAPLISSLKQLSVSQLGNPQPHPAYVFVHYSHPTLLQRIRAMNGD